MPPPILDVHLHAIAPDAFGPPPLGLCMPIQNYPGHDPAESWADAFVRWQKEPDCADAVWSPLTSDEIRDQTLAAMERWNIIGVVSGDADKVEEWRIRAPDRVIPGLWWKIGASRETPDDLRVLHAAGRLAVFGEVLNQYAGSAPDDPAFEPYFAVCEELDIPLGIHVGPGPPGAPYLGFERYRARMHSALLLEEPLVRHPRLRVYVMHAGWPLADDMIALLYSHPHVYVDTGVLGWGIARREFYSYLRRLIDAGFERRIMFGSDQMMWPGAIDCSIEAIEAADFLSARQKRAILYDNAARFLRLSPDEVARHHSRVR